MSEPFIAEIRIVGFNFAPRSHAFCNGQILFISQNQSLFSLLGTAYGGDGETTFGLPDLRGRTPIHVDDGNGHPLAQHDGDQTHQERETAFHNPAYILGRRSTAAPCLSRAAGKMATRPRAGRVDVRFWRMVYLLL